jgi:hypothetical protein
MNIKKQLEKLGFDNVRLYDDIGDTKYYDAKYQGENVEVVVKNNKVSWRYLGYYDEVKWFKIGEIEREN